MKPGQKQNQKQLINDQIASDIFARSRRYPQVSFLLLMLRMEGGSASAVEMVNKYNLSLGDLERVAKFAQVHGFVRYDGRTIEDKVNY